MKTTQSNQPELRFPDFAESWEETTLNKWGTLKGGGTPLTTNSEYWNGNIPWLSSSDISENSIHKTYAYRHITKKAIAESATKLVPPNSILIVSRVGVGKVAINSEPVCTSQDFQNLTLSKGNTIFFAYLIKKNTEKLLCFNQGTSIKGFVKSDLVSLPIFLPSIKEQTKIAEFLTTVDTKIQHLTRKKELLEQYKKGVMQKVFSQEIRFKDDRGNAFPDWEEKTLEKIGNFHSTNSFSRELLNYSEGNAKNIHYGDIHTKFKARFDINNETVPYINPDINLTNIKEDSYCKVGDLLIADASEDYKDIGKSIEIVNLEDKKVLSGLHTHIFRSSNKSTVVGFKGYVMQSREVRLQIMKMATGVSVLGISKSNLAKVKIFLPSLNEQQKITNFLTAIDGKIDTVNQQLQQAQEWKKGLLQKIFV